MPTDPTRWEKCLVMNSFESNARSGSLFHRPVPSPTSFLLDHTPSRTISTPWSLLSIIHTQLTMMRLSVIVCDVCRRERPRAVFFVQRRFWPARTTCRSFARALRKERPPWAPSRRRPLYRRGTNPLNALRCTEEATRRVAYFIELHALYTILTIFLNIIKNNWENEI